MSRKSIDITDQRFGRLTAKYKTSVKKNGKYLRHCRCDCGKELDVPVSYLTIGDTRSCGCLKKEMDQKNLRSDYDEKRVNGVAMQLFKGKEPRQDSSTGFRGVSEYHAREGKEIRYRAWITVDGKRHYKCGFKTAEEAYEKGRKFLENKYLPKLETEKKL